jgi:hypothetical protein
MDMEFTIIQMEKFTLENGWMIKDMVKDYGNSKMVQLEKVHFKMTKR